MTYRLKHLGAAALAIALAACSEQPEGEPIVRTELGESVASEETTPEPEATPDEPEVASACRAVEFESISLTHCTADPAQHRISTAYAQSGNRFGTLNAFAETVDKRTIAFAMNGGTFGDDGKPRGYFVQAKDRMVELNRGDGEGNFYLKPNGVFFGTGGTWRLLGTNTFYSTVGDRPEFGTQGGPMLVVSGKLHPEIAENGPSRAIRNGVGVGADGKAHFVISNDPLSFGQLARYFRDEIKVPNALFLDSKSSSLWDPATNRLDKGRVGPILVVTKRESAGG
ncbi:MAG: phosphodiester glycosidase family protein [Pseudomonadota bacterium]